MRIINKYILLLLFIGFNSLVYSKPRDGGDIIPTPVKTNVVIQQVSLNANNIASWFYNTGIFNQDLRVSNTPGFEWPKGQNKFACFTAGLSMGAYVDGVLKEAMCSYKGELAPGYVDNSSGVPVAITNSKFRIYKVASTDNENNPDFANWGDMVPFGAPYDDVNNNGVYDPGVDRPGIKNAAMTLFACLTDGFPEEHKLGEGFGGGTAPLFSEIHFTAWAYNTPGLENIQFVNWIVINKNVRPWEKTYMGVTVDPDLGFAEDDYIGCDTSLNMGFVYNGDNDDAGTTYSYGVNPPAFGMDYFTSPIKYTGNPDDSVVYYQPVGSQHKIVKHGWKELGLTSFVYFTNTNTPGPTCEKDPNGEMIPAYYMLKGLKKDQTPWVVPPGGNASYVTKYCYPGDPQTGSGWTEGQPGSPSGAVQNCGGPNVFSGTTVAINAVGDRRFIFNSGGEDFTINPNDTQNIVLAQFVARGNNNLNSVTQLKKVDDVAQKIFDVNFNVIPPPPPPKVIISPQENSTRGTVALTLSWTDTSESYNYWDSLFQLPDSNAFYKFQGYEIYEVRPTASSLPDFSKPETINDDIKLIAIFDKVDNLGFLVDTFSTGIGPTGNEQFAPFPVIPPYKSSAPPGFPNTGLSRHITLTKTLYDQENGGSTEIIYGHTYKYIVTAYAVNTHPLRGQMIMRNSLSASVITYTPEAPIAGSHFTFNNGDTLNTSKRDLGVLPIVMAKEKLIDAKYRVVFGSGTMPTINYELQRSFNNFGSYEVLKSNLVTANTTRLVDDSSRIFDGILFKAIGIRTLLNGQPNNIGVIKDPTLSPDSIQTRLYGWDYKGGTRNLEGSKYKHGETRPWQSVSMSLSYPTAGTYTNIPSLYKADSLKYVKIVFTGYGNGQQAYRYNALLPTTYTYQDMKEVPFKVYEVDPNDGTPDPRQLNVGLLEFPDGTPDGKWEPTTDSLGGKDLLYIFGSSYDPNIVTPYTDKNLLITTSFDVMYVWAARRIDGSQPLYNINDEFWIYPYTFTRAGVFYEFDTKKPVIGEGSVAVENNDLNLIKAVPNPYYGRNSLETAISGRFITFRRLPKRCTFKIYTLNGDLIRTLEKTDETSSTLQWNMTNLENVPVASGMYIVLVDAPGIGQKVLKIAIFTPEERIDF